ncbi:hypothetical protein GC207_05105 [bacterium]|nr:hypothetical protein [bacterium]
MRFKHLLVTALVAAGSVTASLATAPYIEAISADSSYWSSYRPGSWPEYNPSPALTNSNAYPNPYTWLAQNTDLQVSTNSTVTSIYWWSSEMWSNTDPSYCVLKNQYEKSDTSYANVPDHYTPVYGESQYIGTMSSGTDFMGNEVTGGHQHFYLSGMAYYNNTYYVYNGSELSYAILYEDGTVYIYNG